MCSLYRWPFTATSGLWIFAALADLRFESLSSARDEILQIIKHKEINGILGLRGERATSDS